MTDASLARAYVPRVLATLVADGASSDASGIVLRDEAAALVIDVSGSVRLAEKYANPGLRQGRERFSSLIGRYFGGIVAAVEAHGGDVMKFVGDGIHAAWLRGDGDPAAVCTRARHCAHAIRATLAALPDEDREELRVRIGLGYGLGWLALAGRERKECMLFGPAYDEAAAAEREARLDTIAEGQVFASYPSVSMGTGSSLPVPEPRTLEAGDLRSFLPATLRDRPLGLLGDDWLAEARRVSSLFIGVGLGGGHDIDRICEALADVFDAVTEMDGDVMRSASLRGGAVVLAAFGLPPQSDDGDADRPLLTAMAIVERLRTRGVEVRIGVALGTLFCAPVGTSTRREFAMLGDSINVAARLMEQAPPGSVLCAADMRGAGRGRIEFSEAVSVAIRGREGAVEVCRPTRRIEQIRTPTGSWVGRERERAWLDARLERALREGRGGFVAIEGDAGIGKTRVAETLVEDATARGLGTTVVAADSVDRHSPFHAWRRALLRRLGLAPGTPWDRATVAQRMTHRTTAEPAAIEALAPWIAGVLGAPVAEAAALSAQARADRMVAAVAAVFRSGKDPHLVVVEDVHWMDAAGAAVLSVLARRPEAALVVATTRPGRSEIVGELLRDLPDAECLRLGGLSSEEVDALVRDRLGVEAVPTPLSRFLVDTAAGHPFYTNELLSLLVFRRAVSVGAGVCRFDLSALGELSSVPPNVEGVVQSRVDATSAEAQRILKVASVWGRSFSTHDLAALSGDDEHRVAGALRELAAADLVVASDDGRWSFRHAITHSVAYASITEGLGRTLHLRAAERVGADSSSAAAVAAFHWSKALDPSQPDLRLAKNAVDANEAAGEAASQTFSSEEVIGFFAEACRIADAVPAVVDHARRALWEQRIGEASYRLGRADSAYGHLMAALALAGRPMPTEPWRLSLAAARLAASELLRYWRGHRLARRPARAAKALRRRAAAAELLAFVSILRNADFAALVANLRAVDDADRAGPCAELATSASLLGLSFQPLFGDRVAERYFDRAARAARAAGDGHARGMVWFLRAFAYLAACRWDAAASSLERGRDAFEEVGDSRWRETMQLHMGNVFTLSHRYGQAEPHYRAAFDAAFARGDVQVQAWANVGLSHGELCRGRFEQALAMHAKVRAWTGDDFARLADRASGLGVTAMSAAALFGLGRVVEAREAVLAAERALGSTIFLYHASTAYTHLTDTALRLLEAVRTEGGRDEELEMALAKSLRAQLRFAARVPIGRPRAWVSRGLDAARLGRLAEAKRILARAADEAARRAMSCDQAIAFYELGRLEAKGSPERERRLRAALAIFESIGADAWAARTRAESSRPAA